MLYTINKSFSYVNTAGIRDCALTMAFFLETYLIT